MWCLVMQNKLKLGYMSEWDMRFREAGGGGVQEAAQHKKPAHRTTL